jgi:hypothetical protein
LRLIVKKGEHGARHHNYNGLHLGHPTKTWPGMENVNGKSYAGYIGFFPGDGNDFGSAITIKRGNDFSANRLLVEGPVGCHELTLATVKEEPGWERWRQQSTRWFDCDLRVRRYFEVGAGVVDFKMIGGSVTAVADPVNGVYDASKLRGTCLSITGGWEVWPAPDGSFENVAFAGEQFASGSSAANLGRFSFIGCTFLNSRGVKKDVGRQGQVSN